MASILAFMLYCFIVEVDRNIEKHDIQDDTSRNNVEGGKEEEKIHDLRNFFVNK